MPDDDDDDDGADDPRRVGADAVDGAPDVDGVVPVGFAETVMRRERAALAPFTLESLKGEDVVVTANGFTYRGRLVGADEGELYLRGELRYVVLPLADVTSVTPAPRERPLGLPPDLIEDGEGGEGGGA